jgi:ubiquinone/menaquinone biosynthesis C-methylase UbiE
MDQRETRASAPETRAREQREPHAADQPVARAVAPWLQGSQSASLTLAHAAIAAGGAAPTLAALQRLAAAEPRLGALAELAQARGPGLDRVVALLAAIDHDAPQDPAAIGVMFDRAVALDEVSSVAIYALGDETLLAEATQEIVAALTSWNLLHRSTRALEIGCGIGRFATALAPLVAEYRGVDVSSGMVAAARRRCAGLANVGIGQCDGRSLDGIATASTDLVLAIDVAPYWHQAGPHVVAAMLAESRRVLVSGGALVVLGWSYRGDDEAVARDALARTSLHGFSAIEPRGPKLRSWDAPAFCFRAT